MAEPQRSSQIRGVVLDAAKEIGALLLGAALVAGSLYAFIGARASLAIG